MHNIFFKVLYAIGVLTSTAFLGCQSTYSKPDKKDCNNYTPICLAVGSQQKCTTTEGGCYQCECVDSQGNQNYINLKGDK